MEAFWPILLVAVSSTEEQKCKSYFLMGGKLFFRTSNGSREVIADDDEEKIKNILDVVHCVAHRGMKGTCAMIQLEYIGFKRERINEYISKCQTCARYQPMKRIRAR